VRNSSLVKYFCAENVTGLKPVTEAMAFDRITIMFCTEIVPLLYLSGEHNSDSIGWVGERSWSVEAVL
jgi:hypothetical protein